MSLPSAIVSRLTGIPRAQTHDVVREPLRIAMDDGAVLLADRWAARATRHEPQPTVLVRSPYGRRQVFGLIFGRLLAERGLQVVVQSVRGTFGSEGDFSPFDERADGLATLRWIRQQPWHAERIAMVGPSYLGLVQWAVAADAGDDLAALSVQVSASQFHSQTYAGGSVSLETAAAWLVLIAAQERRLAPLAIVRAIRGLPRLCSELPLGELDALATGAEVAWFREAMASPLRDDAYWVTRDYAAGVEKAAAPVQLVGGWYDIFLPWMLDDFAALQAAGRRPQLIVGPWSHTSPGLVAAGTREALGWLRAHLLDDDRLVRDAAVRLFVTGEQDGGGWRDLPSWPPPGSGERRLWLAGGGRLREADPAGAKTEQTGAEDIAGASGSTSAEAEHAGAKGTAAASGNTRAGDATASRAGDRFRYDPTDPTPSLGGPVLLTYRPVADNRDHEARADVLTYTTAPLPATVEAIGPVRVALRVRASSPYFDLFARVCDVDRDGASWNVCDALARIAPERFERDAGGVWQVAFDLWPIAHRFAAGNRIRLQISAGAHPRYARNPGTGEDPATATELRAVDIELLHGGEHRSVLVLPRGDGPVQ